jgi:hypothetical protein
MIESAANFKEWKYYILDVFITGLLVFSVNYLFVSEDLYYLSFGEQIANERLEEMFESSERWQWLGYTLISIIILIRVSFTGICLYIGCFLTNVKASFNVLFKIALLADFTFVAASLAKLVILIFFKEVNTLNDLQFQPFSLMGLFDENSVDRLFLYPMSVLNAFELLYWLALAWLLAGIVEQPIGKAFKMVASSYGTGLLLWVLFVMFITVNLGS